MKTRDSKSTKEFKCVFGGRGISRVMWTRTTEQIAHWLVLHMQAYINDLGQTETLPLPTRIHTVEWAHWSKDIHPLKTMGFSYSHCELLTSASFCWVLEIEPRALHVGNRCLNRFCLSSLLFLKQGPHRLPKLWSHSIAESDLEPAILLPCPSE